MLHGGLFSENKKKSNVVRIHKKDTKKLIKSYLPSSLLPILRLHFISLLNYFMQNKVFTHFQLGFILSDSFDAQLLSSAH